MEENNKRDIRGILAVFFSGTAVFSLAFELPLAIRPLDDIAIKILSYAFVTSALLAVLGICIGIQGAANTSRTLQRIGFLGGGLYFVIILFGMLIMEAISR